MASPTTPMHAKQAALYLFRPGGFNGNGLNDITWGAGFSGAASAYYELEIDAAGTPDTYKWRKNGGAYTTGVAITGAAQTLDDGQTITFAATTGHTLGDKWAIGNLKDEATTESSAEAQITDATKRILNPNATPTFTDTGSANLLKVDHVRGQATFAANVGVVTVTGNDGYVPAVALQKVGYLFGIDYTLALDMVDASVMGEDWKTAYPAQAGGSAKADAYFIGHASMLDVLNQSADGTRDYVLLQIFNYDPDNDQTGDHLQIWAVMTSDAVSAPVGDVCKDSIQFAFHGAPNFVNNT